MQIPEKTENFTITLLNTTGGARLGNILRASLSIRENDDPIYFAGMFGIQYNVLGLGDISNMSDNIAQILTTM